MVTMLEFQLFEPGKNEELALRFKLLYQSDLLEITRSCNAMTLCAEVYTCFLPCPRYACTQHDIVSCRFKWKTIWCTEA